MAALVVDMIWVFFRLFCQMPVLLVKGNIKSWITSGGKEVKVQLMWTF